MLKLCHHRQVGFTLVLVFAVGVFAPGVASAQDATIAGTVTDTTGGILPGVTVEAQDAAGSASGDRHRRDRPVHVQRTRPRDVRRDVHPLRLHRARAGGGGARRRHGCPRRGDGGRRACRAGGRRRHPCPAAVGDRLGRADRRHPQRGFRQPGQYRPGRAVADRRPLVQHQHSTDQRRGDHRPAGEPAQLGPRSHADPGQRQAPPPRGSHYLARERHRGRLAGPGSLRDPLDCGSAGRSAARRRGGTIRLGCDRRRA